LAHWLSNQLRGDAQLLVGLDFAFGLPFENELGYLGGRAKNLKTIFELWDLVDDASGGDSDFGCANFIAHDDYAPLFWKTGRKPSSWVARKRHTEVACARATRTHPDTIYKLLGSKQVGKASLTGMRVLNHIRARSGTRFAVWPFQELKASVVVEIYPTLFRRMATGGLAKLRTQSNLNSALAKLRSRKIRLTDANISDHETDALISAAGLRLLASQPENWRPVELELPRVQREGWIFGVCSRFAPPDESVGRGKGFRTLLPG
jgi:hypothetical protein